MNTDNEPVEPGRFDSIATYQRDWRIGQIHLRGEYDFPLTSKPEEVIETLQERSLEIGGLVDTGDGHFTVYTEGQKFRVFHSNGGFTRFKTWNDSGDLIQDDTIEDLKERAERMAKISNMISGGSR
jgi:hypothetical protein